MSLLLAPELWTAFLFELTRTTGTSPFKSRFKTYNFIYIYTFHKAFST